MMNSHLQSDRAIRSIALIGVVTVLLACNPGAPTTQAPSPTETTAPASPATDAQPATDAPTATPTSTPTQAPSETATPTETPTPTASATPRPAAPSLTATPAELSFVWEIVEAGANPDNPNQWRAVLTISASGGDGRYSYFHDALPIDDSTIEVLWEACRPKPGSMSVADGSGQSVTQEYFLNAPYCNRTPTP